MMSDTGIEWIGDAVRAPRTEHRIFVVDVRSGSVPDWITHDRGDTGRRYQKLIARQEHPNEERYWIMIRKKTGDKVRVAAWHKTRINAVADALDLLGRYKEAQFTTVLGTEALELEQYSVTVPTIEALWAEEVELLDKAIESRNPLLLSDAIEKINRLDSRLEAMSLVIEDRSFKAKEAMQALLLS